MSNPTPARDALTEQTGRGQSPGWGDLPAMSVLTLNLNEDVSNLAQRIPAAAAMLAAEDADVVCLQEVLMEPALGGRRALDLLRDHLEDLGSPYPYVHQVAHAPHPRGHTGGLAFLSRRPILSGHDLDLEHPEAGNHGRHGAAGDGRGVGPGGSRRRASAIAVESTNGVPFVIMTAHLAWGSAAEPARVEEAYQIERWAVELSKATTAGHGWDRDPVVVLTGDLNTLPDSSTLRFLTGLEGYRGHGTLWVDAWAVAGAGDGFTADPTNEWNAATAKIVGIAYPQMNPHRRIDFVLVRGWVYGRAGYPLAARLVGTDPVGPTACQPSDHYGVRVELLDQPVG